MGGSLLSSKMPQVSESAICKVCRIDLELCCSAKMQDAIARKTVATGRRAVISLLAGAAILLGGCGSIPEVSIPDVSIPDVVNPFTWFKDDEAEASPQVPAKPGKVATNRPYPKLGSVPKRPSLKSHQASIAKGLAADNENARYTDEKIQREVARRVVPPRDAATRAAVPSARPVPPAPRVAPTLVPQPRALLRPVPTVPVARPVAPKMQSAARLTPRGVPKPPPAQEPAFAPGETLQVATIYFKDGSKKLQSNDQLILREVALAQQQSGSTVRVEGHASGRVRTFDSSRRQMINYQVSLDRAQAVANLLLSLGVPVAKLQVEGKGDTAPIYAEYSNTGEAANRRVEVYFVN